MKEKRTASTEMDRLLDAAWRMRPDHPRAGGTVRGSPHGLTAVAEQASQAPWAEVELAFGRRGITLRLDPDLTTALLIAGAKPASFFGAALAAARDRDEIASAFDTGAPLGTVTLALLDRSPFAVEGRRNPTVVGFNRAILDVPDRDLRSLVLQVAFVNRIRAFSQDRNPGREIRAGNIKKDAGLFLLLLAEQHRRPFYIDRITAALGDLLGPASLFTSLVAPLLIRLPFVEKTDPAATPEGRAFLDVHAFDALPWQSKFSVILGGNLAWYTVLSARLLRVLAPIFRRLTPYYEPAYRMLGASFAKGYLLKKGFLPRAIRSLGRGNIFEAVEFFWSGWNPVLVRLTIRPVYRILGGNRRPLLASTLTFLYTSVVVHPLWMVGLVLGGLRLALHFHPQWHLARVVASPGNVTVLVCAVGMYTFFGFLSGISKVARRRRMLTGGRGFD
jgi:hypothetical protein